MAMVEINMTDKRSGRSIKWLCEELRKGIADEMGQIDMWYPHQKYKQVRRIIKRLRPAQFFAPALKEALDSLEERMDGDTGTDSSIGAEAKDKSGRHKGTREIAGHDEA